MEGKMTIYAVAKAAHTTHHTAKKYLFVFSKEINVQMGKLDEHIVKLEGTRKKTTLWQKIKQQIVLRILSVQQS